MTTIWCFGLFDFTQISKVKEQKLNKQETGQWTNEREKIHRNKYECLFHTHASRMRESFNLFFSSSCFHLSLFFSVSLHRCPSLSIVLTHCVLLLFVYVLHMLVRPAHGLHKVAFRGLRRTQLHRATANGFVHTCEPFVRARASGSCMEYNTTHVKRCTFYSNFWEEVKKWGETKHTHTHFSWLNNNDQHAHLFIYIYIFVSMCRFMNAWKMAGDVMKQCRRTQQARIFSFDTVSQHLLLLKREHVTAPMLLLHSKKNCIISRGFVFGRRRPSTLHRTSFFACMRFVLAFFILDYFSIRVSKAKPMESVYVRKGDVEKHTCRSEHLDFSSLTTCDVCV